MTRSKTIFGGICLFFFLANANALEPQNIYYFKKKLMQYHDTGQYYYDVVRVINDARRCLKMQIQDKSDKRKLALVLDIDDTSLSTYDFEHKINFGFDPEDFKEYIEKSNMPPISPTLSLYKFAKRNGIAVFFISGRQEAWREATVKNLEAAGYENWDGLYLRSNKYYYSTIVPFKTNIRKLLRSKGYNIIGNIGDQESDFAGDETKCRFKLPNPYYLISDNETILSLQ